MPCELTDGSRAARNWNSSLRKQSRLLFLRFLLAALRVGSLGKVCVRDSARNFEIPASFDCACVELFVKVLREYRQYATERFVGFPVALHGRGIVGVIGAFGHEGFCSLLRKGKYRTVTDKCLLKQNLCLLIELRSSKQPF